MKRATCARSTAAPCAAKSSPTRAATSRSAASPPIPIRLQVGHADFTQYLSTALADPSKSPRVNGTIFTLDFDYKTQEALEFRDALLTEVRFPTFDGGSKDAASITLVLQPASSTELGAGGKPVAATPTAQTQQKKWLPANFRMKLGEMPTSRVNKIEGITLTRKLQSDNVGEQRIAEKQPSANWQVPNIVFYVAAVDALPFQKWSEDVLGKGNTGDENEKTMTIDAMDPSLKEAMLTLTCTGVGIVSAKMEAGEANAEAIRRMRVEVYAEKIALSVPKGAAAAAAPAETPAPAPAPAAAATGAGSRGRAGGSINRRARPRAGPRPRARRAAKAPVASGDARPRADAAAMRPSTPPPGFE